MRIRLLLFMVMMQMLFLQPASAQLMDSAWPMRGLNPQHTGQTAYASYTNGTLKWSYAVGGGIYSSPAIASDGTVYVGSVDNKMYAIHPNGTLKWSYATGNSIYSSPAIASDGTVYVGSWDNKLHAIHPNGTLKWSYAAGNNIESSPAIASDGTVYVGSLDNKMYAIHPNGTLKWSYAAGNNIESSPAIASDGTVYVGSHDDKLHAIHPNGTLKWSYAAGNNIVSSPAIASDGTMYVGSWDNKLHAIHPNGTLKWSYVTGNDIVSSPAIASDGTMYVGSYDHNLYAFESFLPPEPQYPSDVNVSVGGAEIYTGTGNLTTSVSMPDFSVEINSYLSSCTPDGDGYCDVPLQFAFSGGGNLSVSGLSTAYPGTGTKVHALVSSEGLEDTVLKNFWVATTTGDVCMLNSAKVPLAIGDMYYGKNSSCAFTCDNFLAVRATTTCGSSAEFKGTPDGC